MDAIEVLSSYFDFYACGAYGVNDYCPSFFLRKLSWNQNASPFIITGATMITKINYKVSYGCIHPRRKVEISMRGLLSKI